MNRRVFSRGVPIMFVISLAMVLLCGVVNQSSASSALTFTEIAAAAGVAEAKDSGGSSVADFDGDGLEDLILKSWITNGIESTMKLFHNNGDGTFTDVTSSWVDLSAVQAQAMTVSTWADFDNDGDLDCVFATYNPAKLLFYRNNRIGLGTPTLTPIQTITGTSEFYIAMAWADYDNDGDLDLLSTRNPDSLLLLSNNLKQLGVASFTDVSGTAGIDPNAIQGIGLHWSDADNDKDLDLYVVNHTPYHNFYKNLLKETNTAFLQDETLAVGLPRSLSSGIHAQFLDYDDDGDMDIYFNIGFFQTNRLYKNNFVETGVLSFTEQPNALGATSPTDGGGEIVWSELDNDGDVELLNGGPSNDPSVLYQNLLVENSAPGFADITASAGLSGQEHKSAMFAFDLENDGDQDIFMGANGGGGNPHRLYRNNLTGSNWLSLNLTGTASNRDGIGARIRLRTGTHNQYRQHNIPASFTTGIQSHRLHFGLGSATTVDELQIQWPSGCVQTLTNVAANQILTVVENCGNTGNDTEPPVINCPANLTVINDAGECWAVVNYPAPTASDNQAVASVTCSPASGAVFPSGTTTVSCVASDTSGNTASCSFTVTVNDTQAPTISDAAVTPSVLWPPNHQLVNVTVNYSASDNCGAVNCSLEVSSNEPVNGTVDGDTAPDWEIVDAHHVKLRAERASSGDGRIYSITITCTDNAGNSASQIVIVTVPKHH